MKKEEIKKKYQHRRETYLLEISEKLECYLQDIIKDCPRIDRVVSRAKSVDSFTDKAIKTKENGDFRYVDPFNQIQDQIGARIICFYKLDVEAIKTKVLEYLYQIEEKMIVPDNEKVFDYEGFHLILFIPSDIRDPEIKKEDCPEFFELQIKTLYQHAFAEANHNLAYKPEIDLSKEQKRMVAFTAAQSWGADLIFDELAKGLIHDSTH